MRAASPEMIALLAANQFRMADLYVITLHTGDVFYYTDYDVDLIYNNQLYLSNNIQFTRDTIRTIAGIEVDTLSLEAFAEAAHTMLGTPFLQVAQNGGLDAARLHLSRVFMPQNNPTDTSAGTMILFSGRINVDEVDRGSARLSVVSDLELLNIQMPRNVYQAGCLHTLFDAGCGLNKASFAQPASVEFGSDLLTINTTVTGVDDYYTLGTITFTSGANAGVTRTIKSSQFGIIHLSLPLRAMPAVGDGFTLYRGCDKQQSTCTNKFNNLIRFRGFPYIPVPETAI